MHKISRETGNVADFPLKMDLQLFADDDGLTPNLEDTPEYKEDIKEFKEMDAKLDKYVQERGAKQPVKEKPAEKVVETPAEPIKEEVKAVMEEVATPDQKPKQDAETNKAFQEMRQKLEAEQQRAKKADDLIAAQFGAQGIKTVEQYETWIREGEMQAETDRLTEEGLQPEEIEKLRKYDEVVQQNTIEQQERAKADYARSWQELYNAYGDIVEDSKAFNEGKDPSFYNEAMKAELARGASPLAAYRNAHFETILQNAIKGVKEVTKQETLNQLNSKDHIKANGSEGADVDHIEIDPVQMNIYRKLMKGKSDADIRKFAKKQLSGG